MDTNDLFTKFWFSYPTDLCQSKRGGKEPALRAFKKVIKTEEDFNELMMNTQAKAKHDRQDYKPDRWPFVSTYLNQRRDQDCIPSTLNVNPVEDLAVCSVDNCSESVHGQSYKYCAMHIPCQHDEQLRAAWKRTGLDRKSPTLAQDCREYINKIGYGRMI